MNAYHSLLPVALTIFLLPPVGCAHRTPQATVEVVDTSLSIAPRAEKAVVEAIQKQIADMQRGDTLVVIPITGDAANYTGGRILRLAAPTRRETYDTDLRRFHEQAMEQLAAWSSSLDPHQSRTDILGALEVARQEAAALPQTSNRRLVVVSDFLEDDGVYRFVSDGRLSSPARAHQLAARLRHPDGYALPGITLCLGRLESNDFAPLSAERKEAVRSFWADYLASDGKPAEIRFDGSGMLADTGASCAK